jgi:hypothetical protein
MKPPMIPTTINNEPTERRAILSACRLMGGVTRGVPGGILAVRRWPVNADRTSQLAARTHVLSFWEPRRRRGATPSERIIDG